MADGAYGEIRRARYCLRRGFGQDLVASDGRMPAHRFTRCFGQNDKWFVTWFFGRGTVSLLLA